MEFLKSSQIKTNYFLTNVESKLLVESANSLEGLESTFNLIKLFPELSTSKRRLGKILLNKLQNLK
jgi:hypothetical protein